MCSLELFKYHVDIYLGVKKKFFSNKNVQFIDNC